jgi:hypothetical protein
MKEEDWWSCREPMSLLVFLMPRDDVSNYWRPVPDHPACTARRQRLIAAAACRMVWRQMDDERSRAAVEAAEAYADGRVDVYHMERTLGPAMEVLQRFLPVGGDSEGWLRWHASHAAIEVARESLRPGRVTCSARLACDGPCGYQLAGPAQCEAIRCIVGNPFRPYVLHPVLPGRTLRALVRAAYDNRLDDFSLDPDRLAVLADALQDAGLAEPRPGCPGTGHLSHGLLHHLTAPGARHWRGCWALDLLLGDSLE